MTTLYQSLEPLARSLDGLDDYDPMVDVIVAAYQVPEGIERATTPGRWWFRPPMSSSEPYCSLRPTYSAQVMCCAGAFSVWAVEAWSPGEAERQFALDWGVPAP